MKSRSFFMLLLAASAMMLASCSAVKTGNHGVTIRVKNCEHGVKNVRLQVVTPNIIRVSATAEKAFADPESLILVPQNETPAFEVSEHGDTLCLTTEALHAYVLKTTGEVWFTKLDGEKVLVEQSGGGKMLTPYTCQQIHADGKPETYKGWSMRTVFENIHPMEGLYGLGQHQGDEWNWKGRNEELYQYNTKVSIPFIVSSKGYGLLFDNYSLSRFGNPLPYSQLNALFDLTDKNGVAGALTGTYSAPEQETLVRREDSIYFEDIFTGKNLPANFPLGNATVVYEGTITPHETGEYRFCHYYSGYQRIFINGKPVYAENLDGNSPVSQTIWRTAWNPNARKFNVEMEAGKPYTFRLEWTPDGGEAYCGVRAYAPVPEEEQQKLSFWSEMGQQLDYYFILGENSDEVIKGYRTLTGKAPIMPEWLLGFWQSRERYKTQDEIVDALKGFRERHLPIDNIVMDWNYWTPDEWGAFTFEESRFPDPKKMINDIHDMNAKIMISCWPKYYLTVDNFHELNQKGMIYQQSIKDSLYDWLGYKYAFYDAYDPAARRIFWRQLYEKLGTIGMDAWWMHASEPNVRDCTPMEYRKLLCGPTCYGSSDEYFNAYSIVNAEAIYDGQRAYETAIEKGVQPAEKCTALDEAAAWNAAGHSNTFSPENNRVFLLTRNGFASEQRYSTATWSGDIGTRWEDMKAQITAGLNFSISGIPFWSQDIGGFSVEKRYEAAQREFDATGKENADLKEWRELNTRWHQFGMWTPMYRVHGQFPFREPWNIAPEGTPTYNVIRDALQLRYRLMPYLYSLAAKVYFDDYTIMRPLVMDFANNDQMVRDIAYQYMFGPAFMICPVYEYLARKRWVYLPAHETWYDFYTGQMVISSSNNPAGNLLTSYPVPYERIPVFVRGGSIVPFGPAMEYTREKQAESIRLYVYEGADATFTLYEDEGTNYGYEAGRYATIRFDYCQNSKTLTIANREGSFPGMLNERTFIIVPVSADKPQPYAAETAGIEIHYNGSAQTIQL